MVPPESSRKDGECAGVRKADSRWCPVLRGPSTLLGTGQSLFKAGVILMLILYVIERWWAQGQTTKGAVHMDNVLSWAGSRNRPEKVRVKQEGLWMLWRVAAGDQQLKEPATQQPSVRAH
ncbi:hypothetical protein NDU88_005043 [Pleurodeles waltl]|uniref:Uncharacterized protein n=1 Tax=Pleurodeles waltl TaxID=8319 RepID=A0AAV7SKK3_PLEWA|nr:hypothetical protein NDU88_005043 [Pleurodeles waltl]